MSGSKPLRTATLPQYLYSEEINSRFRAAVLEGSPEIARPKWSEDRTITESEKALDGHWYLFKNKAALETEFFADLEKQIGNSQAQLFVNSVGRAPWYDCRMRDHGDFKRT